MSLNAAPLNLKVKDVGFKILDGRLEITMIMYAVPPISRVSFVLVNSSFHINRKMKQTNKSIAHTYLIYLIYTHYKFD